MVTHHVRASTRSVPFGIDKLLKTPNDHHQSGLCAHFCFDPALHTNQLILLQQPINTRQAEQINSEEIMSMTYIQMQKTQKFSLMFQIKDPESWFCGGFMLL